MELTTALIWTLRIVLPIILFCIYFKLQSPKEEQSNAGATDNRNKYHRNKLLAHRKAVRAGDVPVELSTIATKDQTQAPDLFQGGGGGGRGAGKGGGGRREDKGGGPREKGERRERREPREPTRERPKVAVEVEVVAATPVPAVQQPSASEEKMHLESLLNYVAFNRKEQQRSFLLDEAGAPPPPPKPLVGADHELTGLTVALDISEGFTAEKANAEAQMVLRGAINFKRSDVAKDLYAQLVASKIEISESTFTLMIEASVLAKDLKSSSDFLMKMETSGHSPASELLDKVMDLYSEQKTQREQEKLLQAEVADGRAKLSSDAPIFVPSFGIPPPPPKPKPASADEGAQPAAAPEEAAKESSGPEPQRTKLTSSAKPFEPQFGIPFDFDPVMNVSNWSMGVDSSKPWEDCEDQQEKHANGQWGAGKGKQKGNNKENASVKIVAKAGKVGTECPAVAKKGEGQKMWKPKERAD